MANIQRRPDGRWRARYRDEADREHARHFSRKVEAQRWLDDVTASIVRGDYVDPRAGRETVHAYATRWQAVQVSSAGTARIVDNALRRGPVEWRGLQIDRAPLAGGNIGVRLARSERGGQ